MESGFLNKKKSSSSAGLASKINMIDGKPIVNKDKPLKSILKRAGLEGKTGSFVLPKEDGSDSGANVCGPSDPNPQSTLLEGVNHTGGRSHVSLVSSESGINLGVTSVFDVNQNVASKDSIPKKDHGSFVDHNSCGPKDDSIQPKVHEASSTNVCSSSGAKVVIPMSVVEEMCTKFSNSLYGYFIGQRLSFPLVEDYVKHAWVKFGFQKVILRGNFFLFQFSSHEGLLKVLNGGPWFIRSAPIFLLEWVANSKLEKEVITKVPVWVRFHKLPAVVYSEVGIRLIAEQVGRLMRMDEGTYARCNNPWGRYSYARCLIELSAVHDLLKSIEVDIPLSNGKGYYSEFIDLEYEWWPPRCSHCKIFSHDDEACSEVVKRKVDKGSEKERVRLQESYQKSKAGKKAASLQQGSRVFKPKSNFIYRPVSKPDVTKENQSNDLPNPTPPLVTINELSQGLNEHGYFKDNINIGVLKRDMEKVSEVEKVLDLASTTSNVEGVGIDSELHITKDVSNSPISSLEGGGAYVKSGKGFTKDSSVGESNKGGSLWEQFNASTSDNKHPLSGSEGSEDEVDEYGGGFLDDMEDYYDDYDQVVLPDEMQALCDQFDIRLNTRRR